MIITISGKSGSGKGTLAKLLARKLKYPYYSVGRRRREMAKMHGMTMEEFNRLGEKEAFTDRDADRWQKKMGRTLPNLVMEGRMAWYFIPNSIKIFLDIQLREAARRIHEDKTEIRKYDYHATTLQERVAALKRREASDRFRYLKHYGVDAFDRRKYDLIIDTTHLSPAQVLTTALSYIKGRKKHLGENSGTTKQLSPNRSKRKKRSRRE